MHWMNPYLLRAKAFAITALSVHAASAVLNQQGFEQFIPLGPHSVGHHDTLLFVEDLPYQGHGYQGPAPLFVHHWFPQDVHPAGQPITYGDLRERRLAPPLSQVHANLVLGMDSAFIDYNLSEALDTGAPIDYGAFTATQMLDTLKTFRTNSHRAPHSHKLDAPVIVYHHGAQGLSDENHFMAEYFASRGYGFVAANFHWPLEGKQYGTPINWTPDPAALYTLVRYARSLTTCDSVFVIGHSWGAQQGWLFLDTPDIAQAFVSMETTIEFKRDTAVIIDRWPELYHALKVEGHRVPMPALALANTRTDAPFAFFTGHSTGPMLHATARANFGHESYTGAFHLRHLYHAHFPQPDSTIMAEQLALYGAHLGLIEAFFNEVRENLVIPEEHFKETFFLHRTP